MVKHDSWLALSRGSPGISDGKDLPAMQETWIWSQGWKDPLEKGMVTHSSILPRKSHEQRGFWGYSPRDHRESDRIEQLNIHAHFQ